MADRNPGRSQRTRLIMIVFVVLAVGVIIYQIGYGFGGFATPEADEVAEEAPTTEQPIDDFAAEEDDPAATDPGAQPQDEAAQPTPDGAAAPD